MTMQFRAGRQPFEIVRNDGAVRIRTGGPGLRGLQGAPGAGDMMGPSTPVTSGHVALFDGDNRHLKSGDKALPAGDLVGTNDNQALTNKTIDAAKNTVSNLAASMFAPNVIDPDAAMAANSDSRLPTQKAVKTAADAQAAAMYKAATLAPVANLLVPAEPAAAAFDLIALAGLVRDDEDRSKNWAGDPNDKLNYQSPSIKYVRNRAGLLVPGTTLRCDHDPVTGAGTGVRSEPQSTNLVRNPRAEGAVPGTPGTMPANWSNNPANGIQQEVVGVGVEDGINYLDLRVFGTATANHANAIYYETSSSMVVAYGETVTNSCFVRMVAGSLANISGLGLFLWEAISNGSSNGSTTNTSMAALSSAPLRTQRWEHTKKISIETTTRVFSQIRFNIASGNTIDITLRIGLPLIEKQPIATSPILPLIGSPAQTTRAADNISLPAAALPWNNLAGTVLIDVMPSGSMYAYNRGIFVVERTSGLAYSVNLNISSTTIFARVCGADGAGRAFSTPAADVPRYRIALAWRVGRAVLTINGVRTPSPVAPVLADMPTDPVTFRIGATRGGSSPFGGTVRSAVYLPYYMDDDATLAWSALP